MRSGSAPHSPSKELLTATLSAAVHHQGMRRNASADTYMIGHFIQRGQFPKKRPSKRRRIETEFTGTEVKANDSAALPADATRCLGLADTTARAMGDGHRRGFD